MKDAQTSPPEEQICLLANVADGMDAPMLMEMLENEGIRCWAADSSSGSFLRSCIGFSPAGRQIFVEAARLEDARGILDAYFSSSLVDGQPPETDPDPEAPPRPTKQREIALWAAIAGVALVCFALKALLP